jgi:CheY-like chemotaxis protein
MLMNWHTATVPILPSFGDPKWIPRNPGQSPDEGEQPGHDKKVRIIVIDDEAVIAETVVEILNDEGFEATAVGNGASAVEVARTLQPDIVLSDVIMPGLNGIETGIKIREIVPDCKIILFSGQAATVDLLEKAREQGHHFEILAKPIRPEQLISVIRASSERIS